MSRPFFLQQNYIYLHNFYEMLRSFEEKKSQFELVSRLRPRRRQENQDKYQYFFYNVKILANIKSYSCPIRKKL